jgi:hypothetical protein
MLPEPVTCHICGAVYYFTPCAQCKNAAVVKTHITIPANTWDRWNGYVNPALLTNDRAKGVMTHESKAYVLTGAIYGGDDPELIAREVVPANTWDGPTLPYSKLTNVNGSGGPFHSNHHKFKTQGTWWVILPDRVTYFHRGDEQPTYQQTALF